MSTHTRTKHYFVSDVHLGLKIGDPGKRERAFVSWLHRVGQDAAALYLLGDIFDFWWEYKYVVPKGYVRVLGALATLADEGIPIHFIKGNHDQWTFGYLQKEIGIEIHEQPYVFGIGGKRFCLGHGDGLGGADPGFQLLRKIFASRFLQRCHSAIHPRWGMSVGHRWSHHNRLNEGAPHIFRGEEEPIFGYAAGFREPIDYFIFGHLHTPARCALPSGAELLILGEWVRQPVFVVFDEATHDMRSEELPL